MAKIRITMTFEYPVDMASYPDCETLEEAVEVDKENFEGLGYLECLSEWGATPTKAEWEAVGD